MDIMDESNHAIHGCKMHSRNAHVVNCILSSTFRGLFSKRLGKILTIDDFNLSLQKIFEVGNP